MSGGERALFALMTVAAPPTNGLAADFRDAPALMREALDGAKLVGALGVVRLLTDASAAFAAGEERRLETLDEQFRALASDDTRSAAACLHAYVTKHPGEFADLEPVSGRVLVPAHLLDQFAEYWTSPGEYVVESYDGRDHIAPAEEGVGLVVDVDTATYESIIARMLAAGVPRRDSTASPLGVDEARDIAQRWLQEQEHAMGCPLALKHDSTRELDIGWVFFWNTRAYLEHGEWGTQLGGNAPLLVDRRNGSRHVLGTAEPTETYIDRYRATGDPHGRRRRVAR